MRQVKVLRKGHTPRHTLLGLNGVVEFKLRTVTYLHIGSGKSLSTIPKSLVSAVAGAETLENLIKSLSADYVSAPECMETLRYGDRLCVPGSSIKGVIRSRLELLSSDGKLSESCFRVDRSRALREPLPKGTPGWRHTHIWWDAPSEIRGPPCNPTAMGGYSLCTICDIFGAPGVSSRVFFGNACTASHVVTEVKALDHGECLELIPPNTVLEGEFGFVNLRRDELGLVLLGMGARLDGSFTEILMGRSKYRTRTLSNGKHVELGRVRFSVNRVTFYRHHGVGGEELLELDNVLSKCSKESYKVVCEGEAITALISVLIKDAINKHRVFKKALSFSEVSRKKGLR